MSNCMNLFLFLLCIWLNQSKTCRVDLHWFRPRASLMAMFIGSRIFLLIFPIWLFAGLMSLHLGLFSKSGLWSFRVMNAVFPASCSTLSSMPSSAVIARASVLISLMVACVVFWYELVTLSNSNLFYLSSLTS